MIEVVAKANRANKPKDPLGRLKSFGLVASWQAAFLLPSGWDDLTAPVEDFKNLPGHGESCVVVGCLAGAPTMKFGNGAPRLVGSLSDPNGRLLGFSVFGDSRAFEGKLKDCPERVVLLGQIDYFNNRPWLKSPDVVPREWLGRFRPRYPGKTGVINPETVRERILAMLPGAIPAAVEFITRELADFGTEADLLGLAGVSGWTCEQVIREAHTPHGIHFGEVAQRAMEYFAALGVIRAARGNRDFYLSGGSLCVTDWRQRAKAIPFPLTDEQERAIVASLDDLSSPSPMRRILSGDVGTGKTAVYGTICASIVDGNGTAAILLPNESLASQVAREFESWWPDLPMQLITGNSGDELICAPLVVGTTALLFRDLGHPDLVVVDEQQKFSREQREQLVGPETNLLEVTATCIPRSQALVRYGVVKVSKLTKCHTPKTIHTRIWPREEWGGLFRSVKETLAAGDQVLLVYPLREKNEKPEAEEDENQQKGVNRPELRSAAEVYQKWNDFFPGKVRLIHGQMTDDEKGSALRDMREGKASILTATTVVEVGINLPKLRRVVIVHPERHGLTTLHQIRGRVARQGGEGWCDLFLPYPVKDTTMERLRVLEKTQDGFKVAEYDMRLRGVGDLSRESSKQSGADETFLFGRPVRMEILDEVMERLG